MSGKLDQWLSRYGWPTYGYPFMAVIVVLMAFCTEYDKVVTDVISAQTIDGTTVYVRQPIPTTSDNPMSAYAMYIDSACMCALGLSGLYAFGRYYVWSAMGYTYFITGFCFIWSSICTCFVRSIFEGRFVKTALSLDSMIANTAVTVTVLISWGAFYGFIAPTQFLIVCIIEPFFMILNEYIIGHYMHVKDAGGSLNAHTFGAYFGVAVTFGLGIKITDLREKFRITTYFSDMAAMLGSIVLWIFWPSFIGAPLYNDSRLQSRAVMNTYLAQSASCLMAFVTSSFTHKGKLEMLEIQNATLAGGVIIGMSVSFDLHPCAVLLIGGVGGIVSALCYHYVHPWMEEHGIIDSAGVSMLHGIPGILGAVIAALSILPKDNNYLYSYDTQWTTSADCHRSRGIQFLFVLASTLVTLAISIVFGLLTGVLLRLRIFPQVAKKDMLIDHDFWLIHDRHADPRMTKTERRMSKMMDSIAEQRGIALTDKAMKAGGLTLSSLAEEVEEGAEGSSTVVTPAGLRITTDKYGNQVITGMS